MIQISHASLLAVSLLLASCAGDVAAPTTGETTAQLSSVAGSISRSEILDRAQRWVDLDVPYSQDQSAAYSDGTGGEYRTDCSGYVSMAWHLAKKSDGWDLNTGDFGTTPLKTYIDYDDLLPGDAVLGVSYGHIVLFDKWVDSAHTSMWIYQEPTFGETAEHVQRDRSFYVDNGFRAIRYINIDTTPDTTKMQLVVQTTTGLYHTVRSPAWTKFGNVEGQAGTLTGLSKVAEAGVGGDSHVLVVANDTIYHTIRSASGSWDSWGNVEGQSGALTNVTGLSAAGVSGALQVVAVANDTIYHAIRSSSGWTDWGNVEGKAGALTNVTAVATAEVNGELHLLAVANDTIYHTIRSASGSWDSWGNVEGQSGALTNVTSIAAAGVNGQLQVVVVASDTIYHAIRSSSGWTNWGNVENQSGALSDITGVTVASVAGALQVMAISSAGLKHAIRSASGWTDWGTVTNVADGLTGTPLHIAATGT